MGTKLSQKKKRSRTENGESGDARRSRQRKGRNDDDGLERENEDTLLRVVKEKEGRSQCACIACGTRIDQSFANYARDFFLP